MARDRNGQALRTLEGAGPESAAVRSEPAEL
jgi:hypothetical protein